MCLRGGGFYPLGSEWVWVPVYTVHWGDCAAVFRVGGCIPG